MDAVGTLLHQLMHPSPSSGAAVADDSHLDLLRISALDCGAAHSIYILHSIMAYALINHVQSIHVSASKEPNLKLYCYI